MNTEHSQKILYQETQYYRQRWILLLLMTASALSWYSFLLQVVFGTPTSTTSLPDWVVFALFILFGIVVPVLIYYTRMTTQVTSRAILINFQPFTSRVVAVKDLAAAEPAEESELKQIGFWEISIGKGKRNIYNISGSKGIQLILETGDIILVGSQNPGELLRILSAQIARSK